MFRQTLSLGFLIALPAIGSALPTEADFKRLDINQDNRLSENELPQGARINFPRIDTDGNDEVSREEFRNFLSRRRFNERWRENVTVEADLPYAGTENPRQQLDLMLPKVPKTERLPVIVFIHGGGWQNGNKSTGVARIAPFVMTGDYAGVSVGYRLTDEAQWPSQIHDCKAAIRWIRANADKYKLDADRIGVWGTSAGGHLVSMLGVSGDVESLEGTLGDHLDQSSRVTCVANFYGPTDMSGMAEGPGGPRHASATSPEGKLLGGAIKDRSDVAKNASPVTHVSAGDAPFLTIHGTKDPTVPFDQGVRLDQALKAAEVPSYLVAVEGAGHGNFGGSAVNERLSHFFNKYLREQGEIEVPEEAIKQ